VKGHPTGFWAKLEKSTDGQITAWHPLKAHCADVAAVMEALLTQSLLGSRLARLLGAAYLTSTQVQRLCVLAALHDAGKVNHGFQRKGNGEAGTWAGHVSPIIDALMADDEDAVRIAEALGLFEMVSWFDSEADLEHLLLATWGHHGYPVRPRPEFKPELWRKNGVRNPYEGLEDLALAVRQWFPQAFCTDDSKFPSSAPFQHAYNGTLTLADWIASDRRFFDFDDGLTDRMAHARAQARTAVEALGLNPSTIRTSMGVNRPGFDRISTHPPHPVQMACLELPLHAEGSLVILESDTGSGKTEAALAHFLKLFHAGLVDGMYFALPTRTSATQIYRRVVEATRSAFPDPSKRPVVVQAVPGYLDVDGVSGVALEQFEVLWNDDDKERWRFRGWAGEHPKRYLAGTIAVGTIDQVLLSAVMVGHAHMRSAALLRHLLIVDEVHASDTYMSSILDKVIRHQLSAGGHVFLMSATLGSAARAKLACPVAAGTPDYDDAVNLEYPLITYVDGRREQPRSIHAAATSYKKAVELEANPIAGDENAIAARALSAAKHGASVLIIRNRVADCIAVQQALETMAGADAHLLFNLDGLPVPHHSRYTGADRKRLDEAIEAAYGAKSIRQGRVAVATQTVEQSLDLDADLLLTDLCPIDVLLQRIGRLHRHSYRHRPAGFELPRTIVLVPEQRNVEQWIGADGRARGPHGLGTVYDDLRMIEATWRQIENGSTWIIPDMNRQLVEGATHTSVLQAVSCSDDWGRHERYIRGIYYAHGTQAGLNTIRYDKAFGTDAFGREVGARIGSRLGEEDRLVTFDVPLRSPLASSVREFKIPFHLVRGVAADATPVDVRSDASTIRFRLGDKDFIYDRLGLRVV
jgi:CRISPR-associated endonuclease/helicase Cas3